jgi:hypothetical protein
MVTGNPRDRGRLNDILPVGRRAELATRAGPFSRRVFNGWQFVPSLSTLTVFEHKLSTREHDVPIAI